LYNFENKQVKWRNDYWKQYLFQRRTCLLSGKKGNNYIILQEQGIAKIELNRRKGKNLWAIIDLEDLEKILGMLHFVEERVFLIHGLQNMMRI